MNHLFHVKNYLIDHVNFLNANNCDIDNNMVFDEATVNSDINPYCVVISHSFSDESYQSGDVRNSLFDWRVLINFFALLQGNRDENAAQIQDAYIKARTIIDTLCADFTLDGHVMDARIHSVLTPMTYNRNDRDEYIMLGVVLLVKEALNG